LASAAENAPHHDHRQKVAEDLGDLSDLDKARSRSRQWWRIASHNGRCEAHLLRHAAGDETPFLDGLLVLRRRFEIDVDQKKNFGLQTKLSEPDPLRVGLALRNP
jgi:hypothetical protein